MPGVEKAGTGVISRSKQGCFKATCLMRGPESPTPASGDNNITMYIESVVPWPAFEFVNQMNKSKQNVEISASV